MLAVSVFFCVSFIYLFFKILSSQQDVLSNRSESTKIRLCSTSGCSQPDLEAHIVIRALHRKSVAETQGVCEQSAGRESGGEAEKKLGQIYENVTKSTYRHVT